MGAATQAPIKAATAFLLWWDFCISDGDFLHRAFLGAALPFALKLPPVLMMVFFLTIGLGFAFPFLLIGFLPQGAEDNSQARRLDGDL
jgi:hypothetical protein